MALLGSIVRLSQALYFATRKGWDSSECLNALNKAEQAVRRPPLAEGSDIISEIIDQFNS